MDEKTYTIYVEITGGCLSGIYGDQLPTDAQIIFRVRDMDVIDQGEEDPFDMHPDDLVHYY